MSPIRSGIVHRPASRLITVGCLAWGVSACSNSATAPVPESAESLVGLWQSTVPDVAQTTLEFRAGQEFSLVHADYVDRRCSSEKGVWSVSDGTLTLRVTTRNGELVSDSVESALFSRVGNTLTITPVSGVQGTFGSASSMPGCADYGWMSMVMSAEVDGIMTDFSTRGSFLINLPAGISSGFLRLTGFFDPDQLGLDPSCMTCRLLNIDVYHELGAPLETGTYPTESFGPTGNRSEAQYDLTYPGISQFGSNDSDPTIQPWSGEVVVATLTSQVAEGTFHFIVYDATGSGPPYPNVTIENGSFRLTFD